MHVQRVTMSALVVGVLASTFLAGVAAFQAFLYYQLYPDDKRRMKILVAVVWFLDITQEILVCISLFYYAVIHRNVDTLADNELAWSLVVGFFFNVMITSVVQGYLSCRIWHREPCHLNCVTFTTQTIQTPTVSNKNKLLAFAMISFNVTGLVLGLIYSAKCLSDISFHMVHQTSTLFCAMFGANLACDVTVTAALIVILQARRCEGSLHNSVITRIMLHSLNTGLLTSICALCNLVIMLALPYTAIVLGTHVVLGRLHSNSLFATLNVRRMFRAQMCRVPDVEDITFPSFRPRSNSTIQTSSSSFDRSKRSLVSAPESAHARREVRWISCDKSMPASPLCQMPSRDPLMEYDCSRLMSPSFSQISVQEYVKDAR